MKYNKIILVAILAFALNLNANETETQEPSMINQAKHNAKELIQTAKEKIDSITIEDVKNTATTTWEKTKTNLNELSENNTSKLLLNKANNSIQDIKDNNTTKVLLNKASSSLQSFKDYLSSDSNTSTVDKVKKLGQDIRKYGQEKYQELTK